MTIAGQMTLNINHLLKDEIPPSYTYQYARRLNFGAFLTEALQFLLLPASPCFSPFVYNVHLHLKIFRSRSQTVPNMHHIICTRKSSLQCTSPCSK